jgi:hypothetical protein
MKETPSRGKGDISQREAKGKKLSADPHKTKQASHQATKKVRDEGRTQGIL